MIGKSRNTHWHQLGIDTSDCMTSSEAMEKANLDWEVELEKMYFKSVLLNLKKKYYKCHKCINMEYNMELYLLGISWQTK